MLWRKVKKTQEIRNAGCGGRELEKFLHRKVIGKASFQQSQGVNHAVPWEKTVPGRQREWQVQRPFN